MDQESTPGGSVPVRPSEARTRELVNEVLAKLTLLASKEIELAKVELRANLKDEVRMAKGLGFAGVCSLTVLNLLCVAVVLALMENGVLPGWGAALAVAGVVLVLGVLAGIVGWSSRVTTPLERTRRTLEEDLRWAKERIA